MDPGASLSSRVNYDLTLKGELKAHIHISLYESNTLQEYDAVLLFLLVIHEMRIVCIASSLSQPLVAAMFFNCYQLWLKWVAAHFMSPSSEQCIIDCISALHTNSLRKLHNNLYEYQTGKW